MTKKPVNAGPTDTVKRLDAVARRIDKILTDNGMDLAVWRPKGDSHIFVGVGLDADNDNDNGTWTVVDISEEPEVFVRKAHRG